MARGRMISKVLSTSKKFAAAGRCDLGEFAQLLYALLLPHADDFGRQEGDPFTVKHKVLPTSERSEAEFGSALRCLHDAGLILWYDTEIGQVVEIVGFDAHQVGLHKRTATKFPGISGNFREIPSELKGTEQKGSEQNRAYGARAHAPGALAGSLQRDHLDHGFCGSRFCVKAAALADMVRRYGDGGEDAVLVWLHVLNDGIGPDESAGGPLWVLQQFDGWLVASGRVSTPPSTRMTDAERKRASWEAHKRKLRAESGGAA